MRIHLQSDTHVEMGRAIGSTCVSDVTVCPGDIGTLSEPYKIERYFDMIGKNTDHIIWVLGNHEFYHGEYYQVLEDAWNLANKCGVKLIDIEYGNPNLEIDGIKFWGSTLWTDLKKADWFIMNRIGHGFNDFYIIAKGDKGFTAHDTVEINNNTRKAIDYKADIIITHHAPIMMEHRRFPISDITYGFCNTGLEEVICNSKAKYWMYGHTHDSRAIDLNGTLVVSNQQGYPKQAWQNGDILYEECFFDPAFILEI